MDGCCLDYGGSLISRWKSELTSVISVDYIVELSFQCYLWLVNFILMMGMDVFVFGFS